MQLLRIIIRSGVLGIFLSAAMLEAQIGKDHMRVIGYPPVDYDIRIYQRYDKSDYTGAMFHSPFGGLIQGFGTLLDEGVTVFKVQPGDVFNEKNIQAGKFAPLNNDFLDFSQPVFLGFRTPSVNYQSPFPGFPPPAYGWAELTHTEAQLTLDRLGKPIPAREGGLQYTGGLQIMDHAMEYGGEGIVVVEKSANLKDWAAIKRITVSTPGSRRTFRDSEAHTKGNVFYRVKMRL